MQTRRGFIYHGLCAAVAVPFSPPLFAAQPLTYHLALKKSTARLLEDSSLETAIWSYSGEVPGPVLRAKKGQTVKVTVTNDLPQPTSVHWHGIRIDNAMDGVSGLTQEPIEPGETFTYEFTPPDAGSFWYHPHNRTWEQLARGLYGALIVEGDETAGFERDYVIMADDWRLQEDGLLHEASFGNLRDWSHAGRLGQILTLNGKPYERLNVNPGERVRLRLMNAANARVMRFAVQNHRPWIIAIDGQPVKPIKAPQTGVSLAPAQRVDLSLDINGKPGDEIAIIETSGQDQLIAGYLVCGNTAVDKKTENPPHLRANTVALAKLDTARDIELRMTGGAMRWLVSAKYNGKEIDGRTLARQHNQLWAFNGIAGMTPEPFFSAKRGETIRLKLINETVWPHAIHLHGHHFAVLSRKQAGVAANPGLGVEASALRDTVLLEREETVEIAFMADNPGKWMLHCHMLEHQVSGMAAWFEVV